MNYTQLVAPKTTANSIAAWLNWDLAPSTDILAEAESYLYGKLRVQAMKTIASGSIVLNDLSFTMPTDYLAPISMRRIGASAGVIEVFDSQQMEERNCIDAAGNFILSVPTECQIIGDPARAYFNVQSDDTYPYRLVYWARKTALSGSNLSNFLTTRYPTLLRAACLFRGFDFKKEYEAADRNEKRLQSLIYDANAEYDMGESINRMETYNG